MRPLLAANWKMNPGSSAEAMTLAAAIRVGALPYQSTTEVVICPPFPWILPVVDAVAGSGIEVGAQDCFWQEKGAYTGEVSATMLATCCGWVIVGHSERRQHQLESDADLARKVEAALSAGLKVIACVGEGDADNQAGMTETVVEGQLRGMLARVDPELAHQLVIAYEPVWAIGTGRNAESGQVDVTMSKIQVVTAELTRLQASRVRVLYGGSVTAANVVSYLELDSCAGCLVGGASLKADEFTRMIELVAP
jgi:triosephosphate isomerase